MDEVTQIKMLCERHGYGRVMQVASREWGKKLKEKGYPTGGQHTVGPCAALLVECGCSYGCDWCEGSLKLTKKVKALKEEHEYSTIG